VAAFYALRACAFYSIALVRSRHGFITLHLVPYADSEIEKIVHRMAEILFAAEIVFRGLDRYVAKQELNLLQLTTPIMAELRTSSPQIMRCDMLQSRPLATGSDHVPDHVLRNAVPPHSAQSCDGPKDFSFAHPSGLCPLVQRGFDPVRNGHCADVGTFADQINNGPVPLAHLDVTQLQANEFRPAKAITEQHCQHGVVALGTHGVSPRTLEHF
jgi:hypothetical protein